MDLKELDKLSKELNVDVMYLLKLLNKSNEVIEFLKLIRYYADFDHAYLKLKIKNELLRNGILIEVIPKPIINEEEKDNYILGSFFFPIKRKDYINFMRIFSSDYKETSKEIYLATQIYGYLEKYEKLNTSILSRRKDK